MKTTWTAILAGGVLMHSLAFADVSYRETRQYTGGSMMSMLMQAASPVTSTVVIHGGRMLCSNPHSSEIIDLDVRMITFIDHDRRTYSMVTFKEIQDHMAKAKGAQPSNSGLQMSFHAHVSSSGATRQIDGQTAREALLTVTMVADSYNAGAKDGMAANSEMWLVQDEPGMAELRSFNARMAEELPIDMASSGMSSMLAAEPGGAQALTELKKESAKMSGLPVLQVTRVGVTADGTDGVLLESQTQTSGFSEAPVDPDSFQIPPGYKAVASPMDHK